MADRIRETTKAAGVYKIHGRGCPAGRSCGCGAQYQAQVYLAREGQRLRKHFPTQREAEIWRGELRGAASRGEIKAPTRTTVADAASALLIGMADRTLMNRSGRPYKPATTRRYERALRLHVLPAVGHLRLAAVDRACLRALIRDWTRSGQDPSSIRNNLDPLRVIFREAVEDGQITVDPTVKLSMPQGRGRRDRVADRAEAEALIEALPVGEQALWACAIYGGLRRGELRALRWADVELDMHRGAIRVERSWDDVEGEGETKSDAGTRSVPLAAMLRRALIAHKLASGRGGRDLVFGRTPVAPFIASTVRARALKAWGWKQSGKPPRWVASGRLDPPLTPISLHEGRHSAASYLIEAGLNDLELTATIGHSDPRTTKMIYGHLFPNSGRVIAAKLDAYLDAGQVG